VPSKKSRILGTGFPALVDVAALVTYTSLVELGRGLRVGALGRSIGLLGRKRIRFKG
jgi:hypothetical protein